MDELDRYYTVPLREFLEKYKKGNGYYEIPLKIFVFKNKATQTQAEYQMENLLKKAKRENIEILPYFNYNYSKIIIKELKFMRKSFYVEFSYMKREKYFSLLLKLQENIKENGIILLAVNNIQNYLKSVFIIECVDGEEEIVKELLKEYDLKSRSDRGLREIIKEIADRKWNIRSIPINCKKDELEFIFNSMFFWNSDEELKMKGFKLEGELKRKQVFISYSHKDKEIVRNFTEDLKYSGVNAFIDYMSIDYGENILKSIMIAMEQSDLNVLFISNAYKESNYTKTELYNAFDGIIKNKSKWIIVKLDDIDPDEIIYGLGGYKYFEWENNPDELIEIIKNKIEKF